MEKSKPQLNELSEPTSPDWSHSAVSDENLIYGSEREEVIE